MMRSLRSPNESVSALTRRRGASLIELMVVISLLGLVLVLTGSTIQLLFRSERVVSQSLVTEQSISRLANLFRDDVHRALSGVTVADAGTVELQLFDARGLLVKYRTDDHGGLTRFIISQNEVVSRDRFVLPECRVEFAQDRQATGGMITLTILRPGVTMQHHPRAPRTMRKLEILAHLDMQQRLTGRPSAGGAVEQDRSKKEGQL